MSNKYIVGIHGVFVEAVIFSDRLSHREVGVALFGSTENIVSAGFCYSDNQGDEERMVPYGHSSSLKIEHNLELDGYLLDVTMGYRQRLDSFDEEKPPFGVYDNQAREIIAKRLENTNG